MTSIAKEYQTIVESELNESMLKKLALGAAVAGAAMLSHNTIESNYVAPKAKPVVQQIQQEKAEEPSREDMITHITSNYKVDHSKASEIVDSAIRHAHPVFPKAHHLIAVMGVESSYEPTAKSQLKRDPALGLMQVRPGVHGIDKKEFRTIDGQVKHGASILAQYHKKLGNIDATLHAYNVGITNHVRGKGSNPRYVPKIKSELSKFFAQ